MLRAYKYRIYPTDTQKVLIDKHIGSCRFVYNLALETKNYAYISQRKSLSCIDLINQLPDLKKECGWLKDVDSQALQQAIIDLDKAFTAFFKHGSKFPNFKSKKKGNQSFRSSHGEKIFLKDTKITLPKFKEGIEIVQERKFNGKIKNATVSRTPTGKYFVSILVDTFMKTPKLKEITENTTIGIDLGIKHYIVTSEGKEYANPKHLKTSIDRLKVLQRRLRNKKKGSNNKKKAYLKIVVLYEKVANKRKDFLHKLSNEITNQYDTICCEDLKIKNMVKNHCLAQAISDASWGNFVEMLKYKAEWKGKNILQIPTFQASTKVCSNCGTINHTLTLADREWICGSCNTLHHRDINAAKVIKQYCLTKLTPVGSREVFVELPTLVGALKQKGVH